MKPPRVLLVNPWIHDFVAYDLWAKPLGLLSIGAGLKKLGAQVGLVDCLDRFHPRLHEYLGGRLPKSTAYGDGHYHSEPIRKPEVIKNIPRRYKRYGMPPGLFREMLETESPDVILVTSGMTYWYPGVFEAIRLLKEHFPRVPLVLGGTYPRLCPEHAQKYSGADLVYAGADTGEIARLIYGLCGTALPARTAAVEDPAPAYDLYPKLGYVTLRISSGCPFRCSYCGWYLLEDGFRQVGPDNVYKQIRSFAARGISNFAFYDDALLYNAEGHLVEILKRVVRSGLAVNFHTPNGLNARYINPDLARLLRRAGFVNPRLGLETASAARQRSTGGKVNNEEFLQAVRFLMEAGYKTRDVAANILMGLPGQPLGEVKDSIEFASAAGVQVRLEEYAPVAGTPAFAQSGLHGGCDPLWHNNNAFPLYRPEDSRDYQKLKDLARNLNSAALRMAD
jgi:radical SAM superfamily enzyme YgiQ (UPF0313 family)